MKPFEATVQIVTAVVGAQNISPLKGNGTELGQFAREVYDALKLMYDDEQSNRTPQKTEC